MADQSWRQVSRSGTTLQYEGGLFAFSGKEDASVSEPAALI